MDTYVIIIIHARVFFPASGDATLDKLENTSGTVKGAKVIGEDAKAMDLVLLSLERCTKSLSKRYLVYGLFLITVKGTYICFLCKTNSRTVFQLSSLLIIYPLPVNCCNL